MLIGVLTDGDLRRRLLQARTRSTAPSADAMTARAVDDRRDALASEALKIMEATNDHLAAGRRCTANRLIGVIQIHDLWRTELF